MFSRSALSGLANVRSSRICASCSPRSQASETKTRSRNLWRSTQHSVVTRLGCGRPSPAMCTPGREAALIEQTKGWLTGPNEVGVLCLTEHLTSDEMWKEYAGDQRGFVVAFDTTHPGFNKLRSPGRLGKVEYADAPISSFLSTYGMNTFSRKRTRYEFEAEWRAIRLFTRFRPENIRRHGTGLPIYLAPFDPACITAIVMREECAVEWNLRTLAAVDARYRHVSVDLLKR